MYIHILYIQLICAENLLAVAKQHQFLSNFLLFWVFFWKKLCFLNRNRPKPMKNRLFLYFSSTLFFLSAQMLLSQELTALELLDKSIAYHDPQGRWAQFQGTFTVVMSSPNRAERTTEITIDLPNEYFKSTVRQNDNEIISELRQENCSFTFNGSANYSTEIAEKHRLNCNRTTTMRNYYTYLYGLPMKLKDPGTQLHPKVAEVSFQGETLYRLRVDYEEGVGKDRWYFYFDPVTFQLRHYQFYHDESANDGEYIVMEEEVEIAGIKMPQTRAWYTNKDKRYLGTDRLIEE